jgi:hypothetical protein
MSETPRFYYDREHGDDATGDGTPEKPFRTFTRGLLAVRDALPDETQSYEMRTMTALPLR